MTLPRPDPDNEDDAAFWDALRGGAAHSTIRGMWRVAASAAAGVPRCGSSEHGWRVVSGAGEVWSFTVVHPPTLPAFAERTPYGAVVVRLDEGVFLVSNILDCPVDQLAVGMRVELALTKIAADQSAGGDLVLPYFRRSTS